MTPNPALQPTVKSDPFLRLVAHLAHAAPVLVRSPAGGERMEACLAYFRQALAEPLSVLPWSEWWAANEGLVRQVFSRSEYIRLKHRRLSGARQLMANVG